MRVCVNDDGVRGQREQWAAEGEKQGQEQQVKLVEIPLLLQSCNVSSL